MCVSVVLWDCRWRVGLRPQEFLNILHADMTADRMFLAGRIVWAGGGLNPSEDGRDDPLRSEPQRAFLGGFCCV